MMVTEIQKTTLEQVSWRILKRKGIKFYDDKNGNAVGLQKGRKIMVIRYVEGSDTYIIEKHTGDKSFNITKDTMHDVYWEDLTDIIDNYFRLKGVVKDLRSLGIA